MDDGSLDNCGAICNRHAAKNKEFAQFDKVLFAYTTLLRMAKNGVARSKRRSKQKAEPSRIVKDGEKIFKKYNHTVKRAIFRSIVKIYYRV